jgi:hypothetical protein
MQIAMCMITDEAVAARPPRANALYSSRLKHRKAAASAAAVDQTGET